MEKSEMGKSGDGFVDRSRVRILVCDNDEGSSEEVSTLLCKCSYQVISVKSPRQVVDALNAEGEDIDIILSEVDLPMSKGLKMLKYIMRDKELRRIPVIMMSAQDEVPIVVKCLKFGAVDYLVKPLRMNELLNLWTHMWRRRRMLGLIENNIMSYNYDLVVSDHSDANTTSTTLISDDTEERCLRSTNPEALVSIPQEDDVNTNAAAPISIANGAPSACQPDVPGISDRQTGQMPSFPKKSELKIGESSAFFTYIKTDVSNGQSEGMSLVHETRCQHTKTVGNSTPGCQVNSIVHEQDRRETTEKHALDDDHMNTEERSCTLPSNSKNEVPLEYAHIEKDSLNGVVGSYAHTSYPYHMSRVMNQMMVPSPSVYQKSELNMQNGAGAGAGAALLMQYNRIPQCPRIPGMEPYPYYPLGICLQPGQPSSPHLWCSPGNPSSNEAKSCEIGRREAALLKFRQKRKERCFNKKIRYVNRKILAERRPRLRGQFVRKVNGINVDLNGLPDSAEAEEEEDEEAYYEDDKTPGMELLTQTG